MTQSITLRHIFWASKVMEFLMKKEGYGHFGALFLKVYFKYGHFGCFWEVLFFNFFVTKIEMCLTGSITSKNKGGGQTPYGRNP